MVVDFKINVGNEMRKRRKKKKQKVQTILLQKVIYVSLDKKQVELPS